MTTTMTYEEAADVLLDPSLFDPPPPPASRGPLHPGAVWEGLQRSGRNSYKVRVNIDTVDLLQGTVSGLLKIQNLTPELASLVTFFEGEIIGDKYGFRTGRWGATEADDMKHWSRFPAFSKQLRASLIKPNLNFKHLNKPFLMMRWKEKFVVPSSHAQNIHGASFAGFYYLCLDCDFGADESTTPRVDRDRALSPSSGARLSNRALSPGAAGGSSTTRAGRPPLRVSPPLHASTSALGPIGGEQQPRGRSFSSGAGNTTASGSTSTSPPPPRPRRAASFSYAAVVSGRGGPSSPPLASSSALVEEDDDQHSHDPPRLPGFAPSHLLHPPASPTAGLYANDEHLEPGMSTPKENVEHQVLNFSSLRLDDLPPPPSFSPPTAAPTPLRLPTPLGTSPEDFPAPLPSPPPPSSSPMLRRSSSSGGTHARRPSSSSAEQAQDHGLTSFARAKMTGYYHYRTSEPYQELSLRYVPQSRGGGEAFAFR